MGVKIYACVFKVRVFVFSKCVCAHARAFSCKSGCVWQKCLHLCQRGREGSLFCLIHRQLAAANLPEQRPACSLTVAVLSIQRDESLLHIGADAGR